jgi:hypothetical protein
MSDHVSPRKVKISFEVKSDYFAGTPKRKFLSP